MESAEKRAFLGSPLLECLSVADVAVAMVSFFYLFSRERFIFYQQH